MWQSISLNFSVFISKLLKKKRPDRSFRMTVRMKVPLGLWTCGFQVRRQGRKNKRKEIDIRERYYHQVRFMCGSEVTVGESLARDWGVQGAAHMGLQSTVQKEKHLRLNKDSSCSPAIRDLSFLQTIWTGHSCRDLFSSLLINVCICIQLTHVRFMLGITVHSDSTCLHIMLCSPQAWGGLR